MLLTVHSRLLAALRFAAKTSAAKKRLQRALEAFAVGWSGQVRKFRYTR